MTGLKDHSVEFDLHIMIQPGTESVVPLYTISQGASPIGVHLPIDMALDSLRTHLENLTPPDHKYCDVCASWYDTEDPCKLH